MCREPQEFLRPDGSAPFTESFLGLRDARAQARIDTIARRLARGLKPDVKSVGGGVHESRIDYGPGYRVYFGNDGAALVILLLCGNKMTQSNDIAQAQAYWADYRARKIPPVGSMPARELKRPFVR